MSVSKDIRLSVIAETSKYRQEIAKTGTYTAKQLNAASLSFAREATKAQAKAASAAKAGAKEAESAWKDVGSTLKAALGVQALKGAVTGVYQYLDGIHSARAETIAMATAAGVSAASLSSLQAAAERTGADFGEMVKEIEQTEGATAKQAKAQELLARNIGATPIAEWNAHLKQTGRLLDEDAVRATKEWTQATHELKGVLEQTALELSTAFDVTGKIEDFSLGMTFAIATGVEGFTVLTERVKRFADIANMLARGDLFGANAAWLDGLTTIDDDLARMATAGLKAAQELHGSRAALDGVGASAAAAAGDLGRTAAQANRVAQSATSINDAMRQLEGIVLDASEGLLTEEQKLGLAYDERLQKIDEIIRATQLAGATAEQMATLNLAGQEAQTAALGEYQRALEAVNEERAESAQAIDQEVTAAMALYHGLKLATEEHANATEASKAFWSEASEAAGPYIAILNQIGSAFLDLTELAIEHHRRNAQSARAMIDDRRAQEADLQAQILAGMDEQERAYAELQIARLQTTAAAAENEYRTQSQAGMRAFRANQLLQTGLIAINSAAALMATFAQTGAPPAPGGYAAIAGVAAAQTAATVGVWAVQPPQFDAGFPGFSMGPTNYQATLDEGEGVANRRGMSALGGPDGMDELNRTGHLPAQGMQSANLYVDSRMMGQFMAREAGRGRAFTKAMRRKGYRPGVRMEGR